MGGGREEGQNQDGVGSAASSANSYPPSQARKQKTAADSRSPMKQAGSLLGVRRQMSAFSEETSSLLAFSTGSSGGNLALMLLCWIGLGQNTVEERLDTH